MPPPIACEMCGICWRYLIGTDTGTTGTVFPQCVNHTEKRMSVGPNLFLFFLRKCTTPVHIPPKNKCLKTVFVYLQNHFLKQKAVVFFVSRIGVMTEHQGVACYTRIFECIQIFSDTNMHL